MLLQTEMKETQRHTARRLLNQYLGDDIQTDVIIVGILNQIHTHDAVAGETTPRAKLVGRPSHSRRLYEVTIQGKLFRVVYDNKHKELEDLWPVV